MVSEMNTTEAINESSQAVNIKNPACNTKLPQMKIFLTYQRGNKRSS